MPGLDRRIPVNQVNHLNHSNGEENGERDIQEKLEELKEERSSERRCEIMDQLVQLLIQVSNQSWDTHNPDRLISISTGGTFNLRISSFQ